MQTSSFPFSTVGIAGLGLIGATLAKAVRINTGCIVFADDIDDSVLYRAEDDGLISGRLVNERIGECDLFLLAQTARARDQKRRRRRRLLRRQTLGHGTDE